MPFQKKHQMGAKPLNDTPSYRRVCFNVRVGVREKLKTVPDWKQRLREFVDQLISDLPKNE